MQFSPTVPSCARGHIQKIGFFITTTVFVTKASYTHCLGLLDELFYVLLSPVVCQCMNQSSMHFKGIFTLSYSFSK